MMYQVLLMSLKAGVELNLTASSHVFLTMGTIQQINKANRGHLTPHDQTRECKTGNPENSHRFCNETCRETNLASLDDYSFQKSMFGSDFLEHVDVDDVSPKSNTSL
ncbi:hypothetical protein IGI04_015031 [Brassica rapa subsp. trilocularis]|uniref:Uncharacterized protein n=1 Tax=Brassica rapa subsp. trilocularis TaxID=1813537 RepID=A0ABQ7MSB5_BRACM|nr:hypothetical protein IGI04_015031 [Brassica rapa subsp. trilocularis]